MLLRHRHKALRAVAATAVAAGIALLVVASLSSGVLHGLADSVLVVLGLPLASFALTPQQALAIASGDSDERIAAILVTAGTLEEKAQALVDAANDAGGRDNISVILAYARSKPVRKGILSRMLGK